VAKLQQLRIGAVQVELSRIVDGSVEWGDAVDVLRDGGIWVVSGMMALEGETFQRLDHSPRFAGLLSDHTWFTNRFHAESISRFADRTGLGLVSLQVGSVPCDPSSPQWAKLVDRLGAVAEIFAHYGVHLAVETGQCSAHTLEHLLDDVRLPNLGVNFDPASIVLADGGDPVNALRLLARNVRQVHVRDAAKARSETRPSREVPVGKGAVDWNGFFEVATAIWPPVQFVIERDPRVARDEDITAARDLIAYHLHPRNGLRR
jgi:L-ribulose-5-phosphate 3-epimerase